MGGSVEAIGWWWMASTNQFRCCQGDYNPPATHLVVEVEEVRERHALDAQLLLHLPVRVLLVRLAGLQMYVYM